MYNLPDEEFDRICREASDSPEGRIPVDGWEKIRERLDREMPVGEKRRRRWLLWIPFFLCLPIAMLTWKQTTLPARAPAPLQTVRDENIDHPAASGNLHSPIASGNAVQESPADSPTQTAKENTTGKTYPANAEAAGRTSRPGRAVNNRLTDDVMMSAATGRTKKTAKPVTGRGGKTRATVERPAYRDMPAAVMAQVDDMIPPNRHDRIPLVAGQPARYFHDTGAISARTLSMENRLIGPSDSSAKKANANDPGARGFMFSAVFGPDFSNVGFSSPDKAGISMGLVIGYRFNNRWSVQAGALYSQKHYTAIGDKYQGYPGYNPSNPALVMDKVEANCFMWDFPLNVRYDLLVRPKHRIYVLAGLSSYLMNREDLHYYYKYNNIPRYKHWENTKQSMYWFSAFNISAGYAWQFTPRWSASVEPYLKLPVRSVGYGNIDLNSMGLLIGMTYRPAWHRTKSTQK